MDEEVDVNPKVKICGVTRPEDAAYAAAAGAWAVGVIFAPESPRCVSLGQAVQIMEFVPARVQRVGVFVNATLEEINTAVHTCGLTAVQLHGEETLAECIKIRRATGAIVIKSARISGPESLPGVAWFDIDFLLLDTYHPKQRGGTGKTFNWSLAAKLPEKIRTKKVILSGGLNPENVLEALAAVSPYAIDVSSGIESAPGIKDPGKMERLFDILKEMKR